MVVIAIEVLATGNLAGDVVVQALGAVAGAGGVRVCPGCIVVHHRLIQVPDTLVILAPDTCCVLVVACRDIVVVQVDKVAGRAGVELGYFHPDSGGLADIVPVFDFVGQFCSIGVYKADICTAGLDLAEVDVGSGQGYQYREIDQVLRAVAVIEGNLCTV